MIYLDTSVVLLILLKQEGASSAKAFFERLEPAERVLSSILLRIEVSRALHREGLPLDIAKEFFDGVETVDIHDAVVERAAAAGATLLEPPDTFVSGDRFASIRDPFGVRWAVMTRVEDLSEEESSARVAAWAKEQAASDI